MFTKLLSFMQGTCNRFHPQMHVPAKCIFQLFRGPPARKPYPEAPSESPCQNKNCYRRIPLETKIRGHNNYMFNLSIQINTQSFQAIKIDTTPFHSARFACDLESILVRPGFIGYAFARESHLGVKAVKVNPYFFLLYISQP